MNELPTSVHRTPRFVQCSIYSKVATLDRSSGGFFETVVRTQQWDHERRVVQPITSVGSGGCNWRRLWPLAKLPRAAIGPNALNLKRSTIHRPAVVISANTSWNIVNFRSRLVQALVERDFRVVVVAPEDEHSRHFARLGAEFRPIAIRSSGTSPIEDLRLFARYVQIFREIKPSYYLGVTIKPNVYGSLAAQLFGARVINNVSGLGTTFIDQGIASRIAPWLYRFAFRSSATIFFHNSDDLELFISRGIVRREQARLLPGSGIDLDWFRPSDRAAKDGAPFRFLLAGRLQWSKGIDEYVKAARIVRHTYPDAIFQLLGEAGANAMKAVPTATVERWQADGIIDYLGATNDVRAAIEQADCIVLPSYREGLPRILLEGSAMGKPLIATDVPGCRDVVEEGVTGLLCPVRSAEGLAAAMLQMAALPAAGRQEMGARGRRNVERKFCETVIVDRYLQAIGAA